MTQLERLVGPARSLDVADGHIVAWRDAFRLILSQEAWQTYGEWIRRVMPLLGSGLRDRFAAAAGLDPEKVAGGRARRAAIRVRLDDWLPAGAALIAPTALGVAPLRTATDSDLEDLRASALALLRPAAHANMPQQSLPLGSIAGLPVGLALIGSRGQGEALLRLAQFLSLPTATGNPAR